MKSTTITVSDSHAIESGDVIVLTNPRHGFFGKVLALIIGVLFYTHLPRPLKRFVSCERRTFNVDSVTDTTLTVSCSKAAQRTVLKE